MIDPYSTVVPRMDRHHIDQVFRAGRPRVRGGLQAVDMSGLVDRFRGSVERLGRAGPLPGRTHPASVAVA